MSKYKKIWNHEKRAQIEYDLARGVPVPVVAQTYGVARTSAYRFRRKLPAQLKAAKMVKRLRSEADLESLRVDESRGILVDLAQQRARLLLVQDALMAAGDHRKTIFASQAIQRNIQLVGRYLGEFAAVSVQQTVSVLITPQYLDLRAALLRALKPYPEAAKAVAQALHETETRASTPAPPMIEAVANEPNEDAA
jgi:hypothetical protein